jgi:hypothetical protein
MHQQNQPRARRSVRIAQKAGAHYDHIQATVHPYLAFGRFANQNWAVWPAELQVSKLSVERSRDMPGIRTLYSDNEGYFAVRAKLGVVQWLPVRTGPRNTCKGPDIPLRIMKGRARVRFSNLSGDFFDPSIAIVVSRAFFHGKTWYLVDYNLLSLPLKVDLDFKHAFGNQVLDILHTKKTILQCAPSWMAIEDFKPEELVQLSSFYARMGPEVMATDKQRCTRLAAIIASAEDRSSPLVSPSM